MMRRSREGAWIEILKDETTVSVSDVAPVRERGLKCQPDSTSGSANDGRSREGAWIEIPNLSLCTCVAELSLP